MLIECVEIVYYYVAYSKIKTRGFIKSKGQIISMGLNTIRGGGGGGEYNQRGG